MTKDRNKTEAVMFAEYIRNTIRERLIRFQEECAEKIDCAVFNRGLGLRGRKSPDQLALTSVVQPYTNFLPDFIRELNGKLSGYFGLRQGKLPVIPEEKMHGLYDYKLNQQVMREYRKTEIVSDMIQGLINKTLDFSCLAGAGDPLWKKFVDPLSIGSLLIASLNLDSSAHVRRNRREFSKVLNGISKNIAVRTEKLLIRQYTSLIYRIAEQIQEARPYEEEAM